MHRRIAAAIVSTLSFSSISGCVLSTYDWDAARPSPHDAARIDVTFADGPAALQGRIRYPVPMGGGGGMGNAPDPADGILRISVYPFTTDTDAMAPDGGGFDGMSRDATAADAMRPECLAMLTQPPAYSLSLYPAPNPASYRFDDVPIGRYCVFVVLDMPPFDSPGDSPGCEDPRATVPDVLVTAPLTTAPDLDLAYPPRCW